MSDDQDGCEWVSVSSGTGLPNYRDFVRWGMLATRMS